MVYYGLRFYAFFDTNHSVHFPLSAAGVCVCVWGGGGVGGGGVFEPPAKFSKRRGIQFLEGGRGCCWERGVTFFQGVAVFT